MSIEMNWAGNYEYLAKVLTPTSVAEITGLVKQSTKVNALGTRHSFNSIADSGQAVISLKNFQRVIETDTSRNQITVEAGMNYADLGPILDCEGYALPNLASLPHISIVGACSTGTHGSGVRNGNLSTAVAGLQFVNGQGEFVELWKGDEGFEGAVVGLGALGIVTALTLDLVPAFEIRQDVSEQLPLHTLLDNFDPIMSGGYSVSLFTDWRTDTVNQVWVKSKPEELRTALFGAKPAPHKLHPIREVNPENCTEQMGIAGPSYTRLPHFRPDRLPSAGAELQSEYFVPRAKAAEALKAVHAIKDRFNHLLLISEVRTIAADNLWLSPAHQQDSVGIHFTWARREPEVRAILPFIEEALMPFGVRPHWAKLFGLSREHLEGQYERMGDFRSLVAQYDPQGKFRNPYLDTLVL